MSTIAPNIYNNHLPKKRSISSSSSTSNTKSISSSVSSIYPLHPIGTKQLFYTFDAYELSILDRCIVITSSLLIIGTFVWIPTIITITIYKLFKRMKQNISTNNDPTDTSSNPTDQQLQEIQQRKQKKLYLYKTILISLLSSIIYYYSPHRSYQFGQYIQVRKWYLLWNAWFKYIAMEIIRTPPTVTITRTITNNATNTTTSSSIQQQSQQDNNKNSIITFVPHGIFPFAYAFGVLPDITQHIFSGNTNQINIRPIVATATKYLPIVNDFLLWINKIDASKPEIEKAIQNGDTIGIVPGGIAEIFEGYPKKGTTPNEEYTIVRKGFIQLAYQYNLPIIPIYCFGSTKLFRRLNIPYLDILSSYIRASIVVFYGIFGLPIPFRQKLVYVIGNTIYPPSTSSTTNNGNSVLSTEAINTMHQQYCNELYTIFNRHKEAYGWGHKTLHVLSK